MRRDVKHFARGTMSPTKPFRTYRHRLTVQRDRRTFVPSCRHSLPKDQVDAILRRSNVVTSLSEGMHDLGCVEGELEPLEQQALASSLRTDDHGEITELYLSGFDLREVLYL